MMTFQKPGDRPLYLTGIGFILAIRLNRRLVWLIFCLPTEHFDSCNFRRLAFVFLFFSLYCFVFLWCWMFFLFLSKGWHVVNTTVNIKKNKNKVAFTLQTVLYPLSLPRLLTFVRVRWKKWKVKMWKWNFFGCPFNAHWTHLKNANKMFNIYLYHMYSNHPCVSCCFALTLTCTAITRSLLPMHKI